MIAATGVPMMGRMANPFLLRILLIHGVILTIGGIPLICLGDETYRRPS